MIVVFLIIDPTEGTETAYCADIIGGLYSVFLIIDPTEGTETVNVRSCTNVQCEVFLIIDPTEGTETSHRLRFRPFQTQFS